MQIQCRHCAATLQLSLLLPLSFSCTGSHLPVLQLLLFGVLLFLLCGYLTNTLGLAYLHVVASGLCCLAVTLTLLGWNSPGCPCGLCFTAQCATLPANSHSSPASAGCCVVPGFLQWSGPALKGVDSFLPALPLPLSSFCCWMSSWRWCVQKFLFGIELLYSSVLHFGLSCECSRLDSTAPAFCLDMIMLGKGSQCLCIAQVSEFEGVICCDYRLPATECEQTLSIFSQIEESSFCSVLQLAL